MCNNLPAWGKPQSTTDWNLGQLVRILVVILSEIQRQSAYFHNNLLISCSITMPQYGLKDSRFLLFFQDLSAQFSDTIMDSEYNNTNLMELIRANPGYYCTLKFKWSPYPPTGRTYISTFLFCFCFVLDCLTRIDFNKRAPIRFCNL